MACIDNVWNSTVHRPQGLAFLERRKPTNTDADLPEWEAAVLQSTEVRIPSSLLILAANCSSRWSEHRRAADTTWADYHFEALSQVRMPGMCHSPSARARHRYTCMFSSKQSFSLPSMPPPWHHHVSPAAASLTATRRCVVACFTKSAGAEPTKVSTVRITNQRHGFFALRVMAHCYGRLLKASVLNGMKTLIYGLLTALSFLRKPQKNRNCFPLWHLHFEQPCLQTCVSTCYLGNHVLRIMGQTHSNEVVTLHLPGRPAWTLLQTPSFWSKPKN